MSEPANEPPFDSDETFGARLMRESIEDNEARRAEERMEPPFVYSTVCARCGRDGAPPHNAEVDMEVCPECDEYLRTHTDDR